jgi:hypothetical protein
MLTCVSTAHSHTKCVSAFWVLSGLRHFSCEFPCKIALVKCWRAFRLGRLAQNGGPFLAKRSSRRSSHSVKIAFFFAKCPKDSNSQKSFRLFHFLAFSGETVRKKSKSFRLFNFFFFFRLVFPLFDFLFFGSLRVFSTLRLKKEKGFHFLILFFTFSDFSRQNRQQALNSANFSTLKKSMCSTCWLFMFSTFCSTVKFAYFFSLVQQTR